MKRQNKPIICIVGTGAFLCLFLVSCAGRPSASMPGLCTLNCKQQAYVSPSDKILPLTKDSQEVDIACDGKFDAQGMLSMAGPITVQFKIVSPAESSSENEHPRSWEMPRAGATFEPSVSGSVDSEKTDVENVTESSDENGNVTRTPYRYFGIVTPKSQWCTDTCGVGTVEVWPMCIKGKENAILVNVHSGVLSMDSPMKFVLKNETDTTTTSKRAVPSGR